MVTVEALFLNNIILGTRGSKMQNVRREFNVTIKVPDREKPEDADKVTMNRDAHADVFEVEFQANFEAQRDELRHAKQKKNL
ncbi:hypothetical protein NPIL_250941 [Nephila pilipes]|uniref:K Homology domain-containing protein n=1 Tax=Nephila pilipes TaxID=299642 RepID=A0A8X6P9P4_NEPPI|nr:hypothetical protein NPIL_250941 [Nephila pilipes]